MADLTFLRRVSSPRIQTLAFRHSEHGVSIECRSMMLRARVFLLPKTGEILLAGSGLFKAYRDDTAETMAEIETVDSRLVIWA